MLLKFLFIKRMTDIALSDYLVDWRLGFKLSTMYIPRSFSSLIVISCTVLHECSILYSVLIWWPMCITLHFSGWNLKSHVCDQDINLFRSFCRPKESSLVLIRHQILVSSANILMLLMIQVGNSFTNSKNRRGPRTDLWGTPLNTAAQLDNLPLTLTAISLFVTRSQAVARIADRTGYLVISNCCKIHLLSKYRPRCIVLSYRDVICHVAIWYCDHAPVY